MVDISSASKANKGLTFPSPFHILGVHPSEGVYVVLCRLPIKLSGAVTHDCYVSRAPGGSYSYSIAAIVCRTQYLDSYWSAPDPKGVLVCIEAARSLMAMVCYRGHSKHEKDRILESLTLAAQCTLGCQERIVWKCFQQEEGPSSSSKYCENFREISLPALLPPRWRCSSAPLRLRWQSITR